VKIIRRCGIAMCVAALSAVSLLGTSSSAQADTSWGGAIVQQGGDSGIVQPDFDTSWGGA
jgi:hypothetical protein